MAASEASNTAVGLSPEEMHLLDLNPPKDRVDKFWIRWVFFLWVCSDEKENLFRQTESQIAERVKAVQEAAAGQNRKISELARVIQVSKVNPSYPFSKLNLSRNKVAG